VIDSSCGIGKQPALPKLIRNLFALAVAMLAFAPQAMQAETPTVASATAPARVIVKFKANSTLSKQSSPTAQPSRAIVLGRRFGVAMTDGPALSDDTQVVMSKGMSSTELAQRLARDPDVEYAVPDQRRKPLAPPNDPLYGDGVAGNGPAVGQWYLRAPDAVVKSSLDIETAWSVTTGDANVVVAVLDTGVRFDHPDLLAAGAGGSLLSGYDMISDTDAANDGDGRDADASDPGDWLTEAEVSLVGGPFHECDVRNSSWHGTQVSGLIAALTDNGIGMASVARTVRVLPVRVLGKCGGFDSDIVAGIRWAAGLAVPGVPANPDRAKVINLSLGSEGPCTAAYQQAITEVNAVGTVVVASAGNSAGHATGTPANCNGVIAVAALRHVGTKVGFSDLGPEIAISAPGGNCINVTAGSACLYPVLTTWNAGITTPGNHIYTDSFRPSLGTSFSAPLVAGTVALMISAQPALTPHQVRLVLQATARPFPTTGGDNGDGTPVSQCTAPQFGIGGQPVDQLQCYCTIDSCGAGMLDAGAAVVGAKAGLAAAGVPAQGLWWNAPANSESGWGINFAHQGDVLFATWFTYDPTGRAWWLSMQANRTATAPDVYTGSLIETRGPAFNTVPFDPALVSRTVVGSATLTLNDVNRGTFSYVVNGLAQTKGITRLAFGPIPQCSYAAQPDFANATNYQDLWWVAGGSESGWGINLTHQGDLIFATWFTYDLDGKPMWLSGAAPKTAQGVYNGQLIRTSGPSFAAVPFNAALVQRTPVGSITLAFSNGNAGTFSYTVNGVTQVKSITRLLFASPAGTLCRSAG
jgi:serine protease